MILLLGGTNEAVPIAQALVEQGFGVLLCTATDMALRTAPPPSVERHCGPLDQWGLVSLMRARHIRAVVDATHPYAQAVSANAKAACRHTATPYLRYQRPPLLEIDGADDIQRAADHATAACMACGPARPILLTIGSRHVAVYAAIARKKKIPIWARVLDQPASITASRRAGLPSDHIIAANGPFTEQQNTTLIRRYGIGVLVTKDSGIAGGTADKIAAARRNHCHIILVERPPSDQTAATSINTLLEQLVSI